MKSIHLAAIVLILLAGCAGMDGRGLVPGQSTEKDVQAQMGTPAERLKAADGDSIWFYPSQPFGRQMYAVRLTPAGAVRSVEQVLTEPNVAKLVPGVTTRSQAHEQFGPPFEQSRFARQQREVWTYTAYNSAMQEYFLHVQFSDDGILREVIFIQDYHKEMGDTKP